MAEGFPKRPTNAETSVPPKGIGLCAFGATKILTPWDNPAWTFWTMNDFYWSIPQEIQRDVTFSALFELHPASHYNDSAGYIHSHEQMLADLSAKGLRVWLAYPNEKIPQGHLYPLDEVVKRFGRKYFCSSVAYMIPMAIMCIEDYPQQFLPRIGLWGCDMQLTSDWAKERACVEYWLGRAEERGIEIVAPDESPILKSLYLYGYEQGKIDAAHKLIEGRQAELAHMLMKAEDQARKGHDAAQELRGMMQEDGWALQMFTDEKPNSKTFGS